ncbi:hypothetical protein MXB_1226, partial [Myxobolus squamalis]
MSKFEKLRAGKTVSSIMNIINSEQYVDHFDKFTHSYFIPISTKNITMEKVYDQTFHFCDHNSNSLSKTKIYR